MYTSNVLLTIFICYSLYFKHIRVLYNWEVIKLYIESLAFRTPHFIELISEHTIGDKSTRMLSVTYAKHL